MSDYRWYRIKYFYPDGSDGITADRYTWADAIEVARRDKCSEKYIIIPAAMETDFPPGEDREVRLAKPIPKTGDE